MQPDGNGCTYDDPKRQVDFPNVARVPLVGKTVLDLGCGTGAWALRALDLGAAQVVGVDPDPERIAVARRAAEARGDDNATFLVGDVVRHLLEAQPVDHLFLHDFPGPGLEPDAAARAADALARDGILLEAVLGGGPDGYRPSPRTGGPGPNTTRTVIGEFRRQGFLPVHIGERRRRELDGAWGVCRLFLRRCPHAPAYARESAPDAPVELQLVPDGRGALDLVAYNWSREHVPVVGELVLEDHAGAPLAEPELRDFELVPRVAEASGSASQSHYLPLRLGEAGRRASSARATLRDRRTGRVLAEERVPLAPR